MPRIIKPCSHAVFKYKFTYEFPHQLFLISIYHTFPSQDVSIWADVSIHCNFQMMLQCFGLVGCFAACACCGCEGATLGFVAAWWLFTVSTMVNHHHQTTIREKHLGTFFIWSKSKPKPPQIVKRSHEWDKLSINWWRISSINSIVGWGEVLAFQQHFNHKSCRKRDLDSCAKMLVSGSLRGRLFCFYMCTLGKLPDSLETNRKSIKAPENRPGPKRRSTVVFPLSMASGVISPPKKKTATDWKLGNHHQMVPP